MAYEKYKVSGYLVLNLFKSHFPTSLTSDELAKKISSSSNIIGQLGYYYEIALDGDADRLDSAMEDLADRSSEIPDSSSFYNAIKAEADSKFTYIVKYAAIKSAEDTFEAAKDFGENTLLGLKILPFIALGILLIYGKQILDRKASEI